MTITEPEPAAAAPPPEALIPEAREVTRRRRRRRVAASLAAAAIVAGGGFVLFGGGGGGPFAVTHPNSSAGIVARTKDPAGGRGWGMRIVRTNGWTCMQLGRLQNGQLGVIGENGFFHNDGRFHPFPISPADHAQCTPTDGAGHAFMGIELGGAPAAGFVGNGTTGCTSLSGCGPSEMRFVEYGLLGPDATSVTYTLHGHPKRLATTGADGAYLIVRSASPKDCAQLPQNAACGVNGESTSWSGTVSPGLITSVQYRNGLNCRVRDVGPATTRCLRVGYVAAKPQLTQSQVASHVSHRIIHSNNYCWQPASQSRARSTPAPRVDLGGYVPCTAELLRTDGQSAGETQHGVLVEFSWTARQPVTSPHAKYLLYLGGRCGGEGDATNGTITPGERLTRGMLLEARCRGTVTGVVAYDPNVSPAEPAQQLNLGPQSQVELPPWAQLVGHFTIRIPRHE
jgi:hypothetical protein